MPFNNCRRQAVLMAACVGGRQVTDTRLFFAPSPDPHPTPPIYTGVPGCRLSRQWRTPGTPRPLRSGSSEALHTVLHGKVSSNSWSVGCLCGHAFCVEQQRPVAARTDCFRLDCTPLHLTHLPVLFSLPLPCPTKRPLHTTRHHTTTTQDHVVPAFSRLTHVEGADQIQEAKGALLRALGAVDQFLKLHGAGEGEYAVGPHYGWSMTGSMEVGIGVDYICVIHWIWGALWVGCDGYS